MVKEIRIYIEGGGDRGNTRALLRKGFSGFLKDLRQIATSQQIGWQIIMCGSRNDAFRNFKNALKDHPNAFNVLLVDSEAAVTTSTSPWKHLKSRDTWDSPIGVNDTHCYLMVQTMESWLIADIDTLKKYYGQKFNENPIPKNPNVEQIDKNTLEQSLKTATCKTSKGEYQKIQHASQLLEMLNVAIVRNASAHCDRLFTTLALKMGASI